MNNYEFKVVENNLHSPLPMLKLENEYFLVTIFRHDILLGDLNCGTQYIVKPKQSGILLDFDPNTQLIRFNRMPFVFIDKIDNFIWQLEVIRESSLELKKITDKMFKEHEDMTEKERGGNFLLLGKIYENGIDVEQNESEAYEWYKKAAECGNAEAMYRIGVCHEKGIGVVKSVLKAYEWYKKAADAGNATAKKILLELR